MKRRYLISLAVAAVALPILQPLLSRAQSAPEIPLHKPKNADETAILKLVQDRDPKMSVYLLVQVQDYALYSWELGETGGRTVVKKDAKTKQWKFLRGTGGALGVNNLIKFGVPKDIAKQLIEQHQKQVQQLTKGRK